MRVTELEQDVSYAEQLVMGILEDMCTSCGQLVQTKINSNDPDRRCPHCGEDIYL